MTTFYVDGANLSTDHADLELFGSVLAYADPLIRSVDWDPQTKQYVIACEGSADQFHELIASLKSKLSNGVKPKRTPAPLFVHDPAESCSPQDTWRYLTTSGQARELARGLVAYRGFFFELVQGLDDLIVGFALRKYRAQPFHFPSLVPLGDVIRCGTLDHIPHHLYFGSVPIAGIDQIQELQAKAAAGEDFHGHLENADCCLKPSACLPLYPTLEKCDFDRDAFFTMRGTCSRNESKRATGFERLNEFQMREIVCIGDEQACHEFGATAVTLFRDLIVRFDLPATVEQASDSFFISNQRQWRMSQLLGGDKLELRASIAESNEQVAVASLNQHRFFFSHRYGFTKCHKAASSACLGFGLERLAFAIFSRHASCESAIRELLEKARHEILDLE